jgi:hypothetical protein
MMRSLSLTAALHGRADAFERRGFVNDFLAVGNLCTLVQPPMDAATPASHQLHGARDVHRLAETSVGVNERRQVGHRICRQMSDFRRMSADVGRPRSALGPLRDVKLLEALDESVAVNGLNARHTD